LPDGLRKIAIIGVGSVGASVAYAVMISGLVSEIVLVDLDKNRAQGEAMDLAHGASFIKPIQVYAGEYSDCHDADIIVFTAGANQNPGETRLDLINKNSKVVQDTLPHLMPPDSRSILLMVSNPVDILTYVALQVTSGSPERIIGSGTVLDSSRFRYLIGKHCRVAPPNIHAYVVGEHGDSEVPLWSRANVMGLPVKDFCCWQRISCIDKGEINRKIKEAAYEVIKRKGATYYAIGLTVKRICESILRNENSILTVSGLVQGEYGISNVCMSLLTIINRDGRARLLPVDVAPDELDALMKSASILDKTQQEIGYPHAVFDTSPKRFMNSRKE